MFKPTNHAIQRYQSRFAGNASFEEAERRLLRVAQGARRRRELPGKARLYTNRDVNLVISEGSIITVYRHEGVN